MTTRGATLAALLSALGRPSWWILALAGFLVRGGIVVFVVAILITTVACWKGLTSEGGAKGVGVATTESVVISSVGILVTDFICTKLIFRILGW